MIRIILLARAILTKMVQKSFKVNRIINVADYVLSWKSKGISPESIKPPTASDNSLTPTLNYYDDFKVRVKFTRSCLN